MGKIYENDINPFQDFLFTSMVQGVDLADKEFETDIYVGLTSILEYFVFDEYDRQYLDYEIEVNDIYYKIIAKNVITALWLSGIFPKSPNVVMNNNEYISDNIKYKFNPKTKKLTHELINK